MKRSNKKGFTIVELVIVIAVIAILAAVLIPTIAGLVKKALDGVKVLGNGEISKKLTVKVNAFSESAKAKIEAAGGKAEVI